MTRKELKKAEKRLLENGIKLYEFEDWITYNRKFLPMNATFEEEVELAVKEMTPIDLVFAEFLKKVFSNKNFAVEILQKATIKQLRKFIFATGEKPNGISKWHKEDYVRQAITNLESFFEEEETEPEAELTVAKEEEAETLTTLKEVQACETEGQMQEILETKSNENLYEMALELEDETKLKNRKREELIRKIIILTIFGVLPRSERGCR